MSLSDLKKASAARLNQDAPQEKPQVQSVVANVEATAPAEAVVPVRKTKPAVNKAAPAIDGRTKMLGARVPLSIHRELQQQIFRAQEEYPDLTIQEAIPALIRLLRDEKVWTKFMAELEQE